MRASLYFPYLRDWVDVMGPENVKVIRAGDYYSDRIATLQGRASSSFYSWVSVLHVLHVLRLSTYFRFFRNQNCTTSNPKIELKV